jgi:uncharacterized protein (DUF1800 family)
MPEICFAPQQRHHRHVSEAMDSASNNLPIERRRLMMSFGTLAAAAAVPVVAGCAALVAEPPSLSAADLAWLNRVTWGATVADAVHLASIGRRRFLHEQLQAPPIGGLPLTTQEEISAMRISRESVQTLVAELHEARQGVDKLADEDARLQARAAYQQQLGMLGREAAQRFLLRAVHAPAQLRERLTWFWLNHFSVHFGKGYLRALVGDYEDALRVHALGGFRDLLGASVFHPAMLVYLDNHQNAVGRPNENHARELLELHTLGADGGYTQADVEQVARVLTGLGVHWARAAPRVHARWQEQHVQRGVMVFDPRRHDAGPKQVLGHELSGYGLAQIEALLDRLAVHPATALHVSRRLAAFLVADDPPAVLVRRAADTFVATRGSIERVVEVLLSAPEFDQAVAQDRERTKDAMHYVVSAARLAHGANAAVPAPRLVNALNRLGQAPFGRATPDGYPLERSAWAGPGQLTARLEWARVFSSGMAGAPPDLRAAVGPLGWLDRMSAPTKAALQGAASPTEWNLYFLTSPEFMQQ